MVRYRKTGHRTIDSAGAFFVNQLDNLDKRLYMPLTEVSWQRDIKLRSGITFSDESTSFIQTAFAGGGSLLNAAGGPSTPGLGGNIPWISPETTAIPQVSVDSTRVVQPLRFASREISYTSLELDRSQKLGQSIDVQKTDALNILYQMDVDQMVYLGSPDILFNGSAVTGLINSSLVSASAVVTGYQGSTLWANKSPDDILNDVNTALEQSWFNSAMAVCPSKLLLPAFQFSLIASRKVSSAGNVSILKYLEENSIALKVNGKMLDVQPVKWLTGAGTDGEDRMVVYTNEENRVRYPLAPIRRETAYYHSIRYTAPYLYGLGQLEIPYPTTLGYWDGI